jgi:class 3 adenylate cyclase
VEFGDDEEGSEVFITHHPRQSNASDDDDDDHHDGDASTDTKSLSAGTTSSGGSGTAKNTGMTIINFCGTKFRIPFTIWTLVAMLVPIVIVATFTGMSLHNAIGEMFIVEHNTKLAIAIADCATEMMNEREESAMFVTVGVVRTAKLQARRAATNRFCSDVLTPIIGNRTEWDSWMIAEVSRHLERLVQLGAFRANIDTFDVNVTYVRDWYSSQVETIVRPLNHAASMVHRNSHVFFNIVMTIEVRNLLGSCRQAGMTIASVINRTAATWSRQETNYDKVLSTALSSVTIAMLVVEESLRTKFRRWQTVDPGLTMFSRFDAMKAAIVARNETAVLAMFDAFEAETGAGLEALHQLENNHVNDIGADAARAEFKSSLIFLIVGVVVCIIAAALLAWKQLQVKGQLERQVENISRTRKAVEAFVPRFFLRKMGYTSILQVKCGESTDVAVAMLFSDIRHFTTVSEGMTSSKLFDWIQGFFKRVTTIIDGRHGNVNQFIGDALFAVFSHANDAALCATDMQSSVQQLNVERQCVDPSSFPIEIGVGLHFDVVAMGILGDESRHTCTTISASVNLASRLEGLTKQFGSRIIASQEVIDQLTVGEEPGTGILRRRIGATMVKGSVKKVTIYDLFQTDERALYLYKAETRTVFERVSEGILHGLIHQAQAPVAEDSALCSPRGTPAILSPLATFEALNDRAAESDTTIPKQMNGLRQSASERTKQLRESISNPRRSPRMVHRTGSSEQSSHMSITKAEHPDLVLLSDAMFRHGVHDDALDALFLFTDGEGCMLLDSK